jgi:hypothetical protein
MLKKKLLIHTITPYPTDINMQTARRKSELEDRLQMAMMIHWVLKVPLLESSHLQIAKYQIPQLGLGHHQR